MKNIIIILIFLGNPVIAYNQVKAIFSKPITIQTDGGKRIFNEGDTINLIEFYKSSDKFDSLIGENHYFLFSYTYISKASQLAKEMGSIDSKITLRGKVRSIYTTN